MFTWQTSNRLHHFVVVCFLLVFGRFFLADYGRAYAAGAVISGTVTDENGAAASAIQVDLYKQIKDGSITIWQSVGQTWSDSNGSYQFSNLDAGVYHSGFSDSRTPFRYYREFYDNAADVRSATDIVVADGATVSGINIQVTASPRITGRVTNSLGAPFPNSSIDAFRFIENGAGGYWQKEGETQTNAEGLYEITGIPAGDYRLYFNDRLPPYEGTPEYYNNAATIEQATTLVAAVNSTVSGIDVELTSNGAIAGIITDQSGAPLHTIAYDIYRFNSSANEWQSYRNGLSNADGAFTMGVEPGVYRLGFYDYLQPARYVGEFYDNVSTKEQATDLTISARVTTTLHAQLAAVGGIQGRVAAVNGGAIAAATVTAYRYGMGNDGQIGWLPIGNTSTNSDGSYELVALSPASYRVGFSVYGQSLHYVPEFYANAAELLQATDIVVTAGQRVTDIDAALDIAGSIGGRVTNTAGEPLSSMTVRIWQRGPDNHWIEQPQVTTTPNGDYHVVDLPAGVYRVGFVDGFAPPQYATEYYNDADALESATDIAVSLNMTVTHIDAQLGLRSHITGRATDAQGQPISDIGVNAYRLVTAGEFAGKWLGAGSSATTDSNGMYDIAYLDRDVYRLEFVENGSRNFYLDEFYNNAYDLVSATNITVARSTTIPNVNITLTTGGSISGKVTNPTNQPVADVIVSAWQPRVNDAGDWVWEMVGMGGLTDATGHYTITRLRPGAYRVYFDDFNLRRYAAEYYDNVPIIDTATDIVVQADTTTPNIDAQLTKAAGIQGRVTDLAGKPATDVTIGAYQLISDTASPFWQPMLYTSSDENGDYLLGNLTPGRYRVGFAVTDFNLDSPYVTEYYNNAEALDTAQDISVAGGQTQTGIDAKLDRRPALAGTVTGPTGAPLPNIITTLFFSATSPVGEKYWINVGMTSTDDTGSYRFDSIFIGAYTVCFGDVNSPPLWRSECYDNVRTLDRAQWITATANAQITGINAQLASAAGNVAPVAEDDTLTVLRGMSASLLDNGADTLLANDHDDEADPLGASIEMPPLHGTLSLDYEGHFVYTHNGDDAKTDRFLYRATDSVGASDIATITVTIKPATAIEFTKTVWIAGLSAPCGITDTLRVPMSTTVAYCYTVHNSGIVTLTHHALADDQLGVILVGAPYTLTPGAAHSVIVTQTIVVTTTNVATWTAATSRFTTVQPITATATATVTLSTPTDDQDEDGIPDVVELVSDIDHDNLPNFLDPDADGDTVLDRAEAGDDPQTPRDNNSDGVPDYLDPFVPYGKRLYLPLIAR